MKQQSNTVAIHDWPALMSDDTLRLYLDCKTESQWRSMKRLLNNAGYEGRDPTFKRHVKSKIDRLIKHGNDNGDAAEKRAMLEAAGE